MGANFRVWCQQGPRTGLAPKDLFSQQDHRISHLKGKEQRGEDGVSLVSSSSRARSTCPQDRWNWPLAGGDSWVGITDTCSLHWHQDL